MKNEFYLIGMAFSCFCMQIPSAAQNVGIGTNTPNLAKLQINGSVGASVAMFGADKNGVTISADNPEIGFNYYFNAGSKTIKAGYASLMGMVPASGDFYLGNFNNNQSASDNGTIAGYQNRMVIKQNGRIGLGVDNPTRAALEHNGAVVNTAALFGGDGKGVSLQKDWPAIGLNHFYDGQHKSIGGGYGAQIGVDQNNGAIYFAQFSNNAPVPNGLYLNPVSNIFIRYGKIGLNINDPLAPLHIHNTLDAYGSNGGANSVNAGLRFSTYATSTFWNVYNYLDLLFWSNGAFKSQISYIDGGYYSNSDKRLKKQIRTMDNDVLQKLHLLNPVSYLMLEENEHESVPHLGFLAQELETAFPEVVRDGPDGMKAVNYAGLIPVLTKAIQEQQKIIEKQQQQIDWLMKKVQ
ncbi:MAG: tail fiber domain-containing protein [Chitinophagaceae bacterium]|jgi:hypothetical protein|nr:tail fiber domain-containing protein [Chitinophagaceae bacterium]MCU0404295.1 tail fiber domain-containing protein [Chitinophagaceae bacterium]